ncbi:acetyl-CoA C-acetyltransferase [Calderihabitans maritimus]|uniref:Acetyl-CoA acetyltransferase n=1 Tax=Calderihabitans maritimus TaxID=1246530 RepID=A0A1Z5HXZ8_9FIRM|nr:acetyl-CoA C-acetyltransferase [Calderihabitans maritimus]GAW94288.1 acetyl-CoA acetyltransferase [Calderihabitans maritimus]
MSGRETVIVSAARTPFGRFGGVLQPLSAVDLGAVAIKEAVKRAGIENDQVDYVLMGMVLQGGAGQIPSRQASIKAGLPLHVPSDTINKVCISSHRAVTMADEMIKAGYAEIVVAGGMESMSNSPYAVPRARWGYRMGNGELIDLMVYDGLRCAFHNVHMAVHGSKVAKEYGISRQEQDEWALRSHQRAIAAIDSGKLNDEIVPVEVPQRKGPALVVETDESPRRDTSLEKLAALPPIFIEDGTVTAGNAPGVNDGAGALVLMSREKAKALGLIPLATIVDHTWVAEEPAYIATVPGLATNKLLKKVGMNIHDIHLIEANEAFAAVTLTSGKITGWDPEKVNVNGGAIAYGHPIGASGARIIMTLIYELRRRGGGYGVAAICGGAAQGDALLIKVE